MSNTFGLRRFRCLGCGAITTVCPEDVADRRQYPFPAIVEILALWTIHNVPLATLRAQASVAPRKGAAALRDWPMVRRWVAWLAALAGEPSRLARVAAREVVARAAAFTPCVEGQVPTTISVWPGAVRWWLQSRVDKAHRGRAGPSPGPTTQ